MKKRTSGIIFLFSLVFLILGINFVSADCVNGVTEENNISQYGITWFFDKQYQCGTFVNGDYWVKTDEISGVVRIESVSPAPTGSGSTYRHGSMVNPVGEAKQSYDGRALYFDQSKAVVFPRELLANSSLISTVSRPENDPDRKNVCGVLMSLFKVKTWKTAILTILDEPVPITSFRPPYTGSEKPIYNSFDLQWDILPDLSCPVDISQFQCLTDPLNGRTRAEQYANYFQRPWLHHVSGDAGEGISALDNSIGYYTVPHMLESETALLVLCDIPDREKLVTNFVQYGIDMEYAAESYNPLDTLRNDRRMSKWPMLFAGIMLDNSELKSIPSFIDFKTDTKTYYGTGWNGATALWAMNDIAGEISEVTKYEHLNPFDVSNPWC